MIKKLTLATLITVLLVSSTNAQSLSNLFQTRSNPSPCSELFFSEYIENSNDKALEIYNPTTSTISLNGYEIRKYNNGATSPSYTLSLSGNLVPGDVYVISTPTSSSTVQNVSDINSGIIDYDGNDAVELYNLVSGASVDIIGEIGVNPGNSWPVNSDSTKNVTMVRLNTVNAGNLTWTGGSDQEWSTYSPGEFSYLGSHTNSGCPSPSMPVAYPIGQHTYCLGDTVYFTHNSFGGTSPYSVQWYVAGIPITTSDTLEYIPSGASTYSITLEITDDNSNMDDSTFNITVKNTPTPGFILSDDPICSEDTSWITGTGSGFGILTYSYSVNPNGTLSTSIGGNGYFTSSSEDTYVITQIITDFSGCSSIYSDSISVLPPEDASFPSLEDVCDYQTLTLTHTDATGIWSGVGVTDLGNGSGEFSDTSGIYYISYTTGGVCPDTFQDTIEVFESPMANFNFTGSFTVDFTNTSTGSISVYEWDFDDGSTSSQTDPSHTYTTDGTYNVCLIVENSEGCTDTLCQNVIIAGVGVNELGLNNISFYPNPASHAITINASEPLNVRIFNVVGELMIQEQIDSKKTISVRNLASGSYLIQFEQGGHLYTEKLIIK